AAQQQRHNRGPVLLLATTHKQAELDTLACACALGAAEIRVEYFAANLQPSELILAREVIAAHQVWIHFHPLPTAQQQQWQEYLQQQQFPHCLSGTVPYDVSHNQQIEIMPALLSQQVRQYIHNSHGRMQEVPATFGQRYGEQQ